MPDRSDFSLMFSRALGSVVVHVHGALDSGSAPTLKDRMFDIIDGQGNRQVVLDLRSTTGVDIDGMSVLVDALARMDKYGGELLLSGPNASVLGALRGAGLEEMFFVTPAWAHPARGGLGANRKAGHESAP